MSKSFSPKKSAKKVVLSITVWVVIALLLLTVAFTVTTLFIVDNPNASPKGKRYVTLTQDDPVIGAFEGDMIVVEVVDEFSHIKLGDVITYGKNDGAVVTRKISEKIPEPNTNGSIVWCFRVEGESNYVHPNQVYGAYKLGGEEVGKTVSGYGRLVNFMHTSGGYVVFVILPIVLIFAYFGIKLVGEVIVYEKAKKQD